MTIAPLLCILSTESSTASDSALCKFAQFLGLQVEIVALQGDLKEVPQSLRSPCPGGRIFALGQPTLGQIFQWKWFIELLADAKFLFVYDFTSADHSIPALEWLSNGAFISVSDFSNVPLDFSLHSNVTHGHSPVLGRSFRLESASTSVFSGATHNENVETYVSINGQPYFTSVKRGNSLVFLLAGEGLVDIDTVLAPNASIRPWYAQLIAMSIVLRTAAGPWCWTSPVTPANFIVDDPSLKKRYGFVQYKTLLPALAQAGGALTVAFIPYNYRRSDRKTIDLLRQYPNRFSICVHGCDHTGGEYASPDENWLKGLTSCACERMDAHTRMTGFPYDNVMVFPQGEFSTKGLAALKYCGFDAAINTTQWPVDVEDDRLTIRDLIDVAVTHYESFPIFKRRYPVDVFDFAFDALFQKPILAVEHHGYFRHGCEPLAKAVRDISNIAATVVWMPLGQAIASSCLLRQLGNNRYAVRHFARALHLENPTAAGWHLSLEMPVFDDPIKAVIIDGKDVSFEIISGQLRYEHNLPARQQMTAQIVHHLRPQVAWRPSVKYRLRTWLRRKLSDIRDNQLARSEWLLAIVERLKRIVTQ